jgi:trigger factor
MQVSVESGEGLEKRLLVDLPADRVNEAVDKKLAEVAKTVKMNGFRPGKAPLRVVKQQYGDAVRHDVYGVLIQETYYEALSEQKVMPVGDPSIEFRDATEEGGFSYTATFEVMPKIELADMKGKSITKVTAEVTDADVDDMINKLREQRTTFSDVERAAQDGDQVHIDFKGFIDGEAFDGGSAENVPLVLGSGSMIEGFEAALLGASAGDERSFEVNFPEDYRAENLAGKPATFEVKVSKVAEPKLPEIDEEFCKEFGVKEGTEAALRAEVSSNMKAELEQKLQGMLKDESMKILRESNELDIPKSMVTQEAERMKQQAIQEMAQRGQQVSVDLPASIFEEQAKTRVHLGLLVAEIIDGQELKATEDEVRDTITKMSGSYEDPQEVIDFYMNNEQQRSMLENLVLENKVNDWVVSQLDVAEESRTFSEVMNPGQ